MPLVTQLVTACATTTGQEAIVRGISDLAIRSATVVTDHRPRNVSCVESTPTLTPMVDVSVTETGQVLNVVPMTVHVIARV